jgi:hypothetical protein
VASKTDPANTGWADQTKDSTLRIMSRRFGAIKYTVTVIRLRMLAAADF